MSIPWWIWLLLAIFLVLGILYLVGIRFELHQYNQLPR